MTDTPKPLALDLAEWMEMMAPFADGEAWRFVSASAELRRQHQAIVELRKALQPFVAHITSETFTSIRVFSTDIAHARATLTKQEP